MRTIDVVLVVSLACATACGLDVRGTRVTPTRDTDPTSPTIGGATTPASGTAISPPTDAGADAIAPSVFDGAPPYAAKSGPPTDDDKHPNDEKDPAGLACLGCHDGSTEAPRFVLGGTVYADAAGTTPLAKAEVRVVSGADVFVAYTNGDGNFFVTGASSITTGHAGVRDATSTRDMPGTIASGDCNGCHDGTTTPRIHLP